MNSEILSTLDNETQLRILTGTLNEGKLSDPQKQQVLDICKTTLQQFKIQTNVKLFVEQHPDYLFEGKFPPIDTKNFPDGLISEGTQATYAKNLTLVFNCVNSKATNMGSVCEEKHDDFRTANLTGTNFGAFLG